MAKELWFAEYHDDNTRLDMRVTRELVAMQSEFQAIEIFETPTFGRVLTLDGLVMLTEKDEFIYHDMITHVPMAVHPQVQNVLLIGGGDGGSLRELCRYPEVEHIDMVEIDSEVINQCRRFLPQVASAYDDPRLNLIIADGLKFVRHNVDKYDLIVIDSTDPFGPGESLFTKEFYSNCHRALRADGILVNQHESPYYPADAEEARLIYQRLTATFPLVRVYQAHIPCYPSGHWLFGFASKRWDPLRDFDAERWNARGLYTRYYNTDLHTGCFQLPTHVKELLESKDE